MNDQEFGDYLKNIEMLEAGHAIMPDVPVVARLDGRAFHTFTRDLYRPFDESFVECMAATTKALVHEFRPDVGYTQSDEISLVWRKLDLFGNRYQKLTSVLAGYASTVFYRNILTFLPRKKDQTPCFDCRIFPVPNLDVALDFLRWREDDATRNSIISGAQSLYSHKELQNKNRKEMMDMMHAKGVNWNNYPAYFKRGTYFQRVVVERLLSEEELFWIPEAHRPTGPVKRTEVQALDLEPIGTYSNEALKARFFISSSTSPA